MPETINRKNKKAVSALPPGIHLYAANMMPPNFERSVGPLARRITIIQFPRHVSVNQDGSVKAWVRKDYWRTIVGLTQTDSEKARLQEGILNFMKEGLARLVAQHGMFTHIESSQRALESWHKDSNAVLQFLEDIDQGEAHKDGVKVVRREGLRISRVAFYEVFKEWCQVAGIPEGRISRAKFYQALQGAGIEEAKSNGERLVVGFGVGSTANSVA
jgi:phage/plasmid-associated DNA primase